MNVEEDIKSESATKDKDKLNRDGKLQKIDKQKVSVLADKTLNDENVDEEFKPSENGATNIEWLVEDVEENTENIIQADIETEKTMTTESSRNKKTR